MVKRNNFNIPKVHQMLEFALATSVELRSSRGVWHTEYSPGKPRVARRAVDALSKPRSAARNSPSFFLFSTRGNYTNNSTRHNHCLLSIITVPRCLRKNWKTRAWTVATLNSWWTYGPAACASMSHFYKSRMGIKAVAKTKSYFT